MPRASHIAASTCRPTMLTPETASPTNMKFFLPSAAPLTSVSWVPERRFFSKATGNGAADHARVQGGRLSLGQASQDINLCRAAHRCTDPRRAVGHSPKTKPRAFQLERLNVSRRRLVRSTIASQPADGRRVRLARS